MDDRYTLVRRTLGDELFEKVTSSRVLMVGAGGIGCELLKNLVMTGFKNIDVIDLDTIDVSNLNRQFLFRPEHVGMSKAQVAREVVMQFNPDTTITAHHGNVKSSEFGLNYIGQFSLVLNALDNVDARRHVNRLCLAKKVPLIESGTAGYLGQVTVIKKGETECYECAPKATQKQYPICTIRSTPDKPVHCIVWAKEFFKLMFGEVTESMLYEDPSTGEESTYMNQVNNRPGPDATPEEVTAYAQGVMCSIFTAEIEKKIGMNKYKGATRKPAPIDAATIKAVCSTAMAKQGEQGARQPGWDRAKWGTEESIKELLSCVHEVFRSKSLREMVGSLTFDKDDRLSMGFVTAACNLRSIVFHIDLQSYYEAKGIAGNIIPAIATTNAIIAGLQVTQALKILDAKQPIKEACKFIYCLREKTRNGSFLQPCKLESPSSKCYVCSSHQQEVHLDTTAFTFQMLVDKVLKKRLGINEPTVGIGFDVVYEEGEGAETSLAKNLPKRLADMPGGGIKDGTQVSVEDFSQDLTINLIIYHAILDEEEYPDGFKVVGAVPKAAPAATPAAAPLAATANGHDYDDEICEVVVDPPTAEELAARNKMVADQVKERASRKRARAEEAEKKGGSGGGPASKKLAAAAAEVIDISDL